MAEVLIIGDGPGGLSAALFLARGGQDVVLFGQDKTAMHWAELNNYLGVTTIHGSEFQKIARSQAQAAGAILRDERITELACSDDGFVGTTDAGESIHAGYLILSEGKGPKLATSIGLETHEDGAIKVDRNGLSSVANVYVVGRSTRPGRSQAIISAGDGAAAAIDILSTMAGKAVCDWDSAPTGEG